MIAGIFHKGSGIGNQLHRYVMTRVLALDKKYEFGMCFPENNKMTFMNLDMGVPVHGLEHEFAEKRVNNADGVDIREFDHNIAYIKDNTLIDGEFQAELYFNHRLDEVREWLKVLEWKSADDTCIIGFRGGEFVGVKDLFLPKEYWEKAITMMKMKGITQFEVHTDDSETAQEFFPDYSIVQHPELNWRAVRSAKNLIISNSSFYILPALLGDAEQIIAPQYWARRNLGFWALPQNEYKRFTYI